LFVIGKRDMEADAVSVSVHGKATRRLASAEVFADLLQAVAPQAA